MNQSQQQKCTQNITIYKPNRVVVNATLLQGALQIQQHVMFSHRGSAQPSSRLKFINGYHNLTKVRCFLHP